MTEPDLPEQPPKESGPEPKKPVPTPVDKESVEKAAKAVKPEKPEKPEKDPLDNSALSKVAGKIMKRNKLSTADLFDKAESLGVDPFETLLLLADGNALALDIDTNKGISPELRAMAARECLKYMYPTVKQVEHSGKDGGQIDVKLNLVNQLMDILK